MEKPLKPLKPKERQFARQYVINNENGAKTVKEVFKVDDEEYARVKAHRLITKDNVATEIENVKVTLKLALEKQGITPQKIAEKIDVLLTAKDQNGITDYTAVDKGIKHATNIYGIEDIPERTETRNTYNFIFSKEVQNEVKQIEERIKAQLTKPHAKEN